MQRRYAGWPQLQLHKYHRRQQLRRHRDMDLRWQQRRQHRKLHRSESKYRVSDGPLSEQLYYWNR